MPEPRTITQQIEHNWEQVRNSPEAKEAFRKLPKETFAEDAPKCRESATAYLNFESYKQCLQRLKTHQSKLHPETEANFAGRAEEALTSYRSFVSSAEKIATSFRESGVEDVLSQNGKKLCWQLPHNKHFPRFTETLRAMGVSESDISHYTTVLKEKDWDLLHIQGANGTFTGVAKVASEHVATLEKMVSAVKKHGVPTLEGGGSAAPAIPIIAVVAAGIICVAVGACEFLF
jgi:hypothetical protein